MSTDNCLEAQMDNLTNQASKLVICVKCVEKAGTDVLPTYIGETSITAHRTTHTGTSCQEAGLLIIDGGPP